MEHDEIYDKICNPRLDRIEHQLTNGIPHWFHWIIGLVLGSWISIIGLMFLGFKIFMK